MLHFSAAAFSMRPSSTQERNDDAVPDFARSGTQACTSHTAECRQQKRKTYCRCSDDAILLIIIYRSAQITCAACGQPSKRRHYRCFDGMPGYFTRNYRATGRDEASPSRNFNDSPTPAKEIRRTIWRRALLFSISRTPPPLVVDSVAIPLQYYKPLALRRRLSP